MTSCGVTRKGIYVAPRKMQLLFLIGVFFEYKTPNNSWQFFNTVEVCWVDQTEIAGCERRCHRAVDESQEKTVHLFSVTGRKYNSAPPIRHRRQW